MLSVKLISLLSSSLIGHLYFYLKKSVSPLNLLPLQKCVCSASLGSPECIMILGLFPFSLSVRDADIPVLAGCACGPVNLRFFFGPACPGGPSSATDPGEPIGPLLVLFGPLPRMIQAGLWSCVL